MTFGWKIYDEVRFIEQASLENEHLS